MIYAIIPARGGSKGIPRKNLVDVCGKPLVAWSIEQALAAECVDRVFVSTDDDEIADVSFKYGAQVIGRPGVLSGDDATSESAIVHALDTIDDDPRLVVFLQPTSPIRAKQDIDLAVEALTEDNADSLFSCRHIDGYVWQGCRWNELMPVTYGCNGRSRRQDSKTLAVEENGSIYVFRPEILREYGSRLGGRIATYVQGLFESLQIDTERDLVRVRQVMESIYGVGCVHA